MAKPKTRFLVRADGVVTQLFSVTDQPNGGLTIVMTPELNFEDPKEGSVGIELFKFSVHVSPDSPEGVTISRTEVLKDGRSKLSGSSFIRDGKQRLLWPLLTTTCSDRSREHYIPKHTRSRDRQIHVAEYEPATAVLIYSLVASVGGREFRARPESVLNVISHTFGRFSLSVFYGFLHTPSTPMACFTARETSLPRGEGIQALEVHPEFEWTGVDSPDAARLWSMLRQSGIDVCSGHFRRVVAADPDMSDAHMEDLGARCMLIQREPPETRTPRSVLPSG